MSEILFYTEFAADSAVRRKLRATKSVRLPAGFQVLSESDFAGRAEVRRIEAPWPGRAPPGSVAISVGHVFTTEEKELFLRTLRLGNFHDLNAPVADFDFSLLASRPRHFNVLTFTANEVTKHCAWKEKGRAEVHFLKSLPPELRRYYPAVLGEEERGDGFVYRMSHFRRFDLGRLARERTLTLENWRDFYRGLAGYFSALPRKNVGRDVVRERLKALFIDKLRDRLREFRAMPAFAEPAERFRASTGFDFAARAEELTERLHAIVGASERDELVLSHGDLSFCNILYDIESGEIGFVDPRGDDGGDSFRPVEYDLAKLAHSALGQYEMLSSSESFDEDGRAALEPPFLEFLDSFDVERKTLRLYEASLFWSLLPLHADQPGHLLPFLLAGERALKAGS